MNELIEKLLKTLKEELKIKLLSGDFKYSFELKDSIKIGYLIIDFYIEGKKAIINPFQQINIDLSEDEEILFYNLLVQKGLNISEARIKAIEEIKRLAKKYNLNLNNL